MTMENKTFITRADDERASRSTLSLPAGTADSGPACRTPGQNRGAC